LGFSLQGFSPSQSLHTLSNAVSFVAFAPRHTVLELDPKLSCASEHCLQGLALCEDSPLIRSDFRQSE
jgi:hypothetical protein